MNLQLIILVVGLLTTIAALVWNIPMNNSRSDKLEGIMDSIEKRVG